MLTEVGDAVLEFCVHVKLPEESTDGLHVAPVEPVGPCGPVAPVAPVVP